MANNFNIVWSGPKLDGKLDYNYWQIMMTTHLKAQNLWNFIEPGLAEGADANSQRRDQLALGQIHQGIDYSVFGQIAKAITAKEAWEILEVSYKGVDRAQKSKLQSLRRLYDRCEMTSTETVEQYFCRLTDLVNKMRLYGDRIEEGAVVEKVLRTIPLKYDHVVSSITESHDTESMTIAELKGMVESHIERIEAKSEPLAEEALKSQVNLNMIGSNQKGGGFGRGRGRGGSRGRGRGNSNQGRGGDNANQHKFPFHCYNCGKYGHKIADCWNKKNNHDNQANIAENSGEHSNEYETLFLASNVLLEDENRWFLDTGCSNHMCGRKELFSELDESVRSEVTFGNKTKVPIMGKGTISIQLKDGTHNFISDVFFVPELHQNLLSMGQLSEKGYDMRITQGYCTITDAKGNFTTKVNMTKNRLFPLKLHHAFLSCCNSEIPDDNWLWHMRFGHFHFSGLNYLARKKLVSDLPVVNIPDRVCEICVIGKKHKEPFPVGKSWRATQQLEIVHSDLCSLEVQSHGGSKYFVTFIDDLSRKTWIYFLRQKSDACDVFKQFKSFVEKQSGFEIKILRTDRGTEYIACDDFLKKHGIQHQMTARYTPQQNGVAERKNRTVLDMVRCMLKSKNLPKSFWAEAVACAVYVLNRCPTKSVRDKTPEEAWSERRPSIRHLKIFGCLAYAHVPDQLRKKLDDKGEKCIFIGYSDTSKAYKLYNPETKKIVISRDVIFDEYGVWDWSAKEESSVVVPVIPSNIDEQPIPDDVQSPFSPESSVRRSQRERHLPARLQDYALGNDNDLSNEEIVQFALFADCDPISFEDAATETHWLKAMDEEIHAIEKNGTWELTDLPPRKKPIGVKWVYKTKYKSNGEVDRFKARLVAKGYKQKPGIDYFEVFAPVSRLDTVRMIISIAAQNNWKLHQMDVKSAFLNGFLEEEIYVEQPTGYVRKREENKVYKLKKALYGLKQAPRAWYSCIDSYFVENGFMRCPYEHALYVKYSEFGDIVIICLYVDDLIFTGNNLKLISEFREALISRFEMTDMGLMCYFLGLEVSQMDNGIFISQKKFASDILKKFNMKDCKSVLTPVAEKMKLSKDEGGENVNVTTYKSLIGSLRYLVATRPDISFGVGLLSRFMEEPKESHWAVAKRILRYIKGTSNDGIFYSTNEVVKLVGYTDSDWAGDIETRKSTSGYAFYLGSAIFSWSSKKQQVVALSTAEAEYIAATNCATQAIWLRKILEFLQHQQDAPTTIFCDNKSAIALSKNPVFHGRSKHIDIKYHKIRELVARKQISIEYCSSDCQVADIFTKPLKTESFLKLKKAIGITSFFSDLV